MNEFLRIPTKRFDEVTIGSFFTLYGGQDSVRLYEKKSLSSAYELALVSHHVVTRTGFVVNVTKAQQVITL
jgi:hypothetical protein